MGRSPFTFTSNVTTPVHLLSNNQLEKYPTTVAQLTLQNTIYEAVFETTLERLLKGERLVEILQSDPRGISVGEFTKWMYKCPKRKARYDETMTYLTEPMAHEMLDIVDGKDDPTEELKRSVERVKVRQWLMSKWNPERYGEREKNNGAAQIVVNVNRRGVTMSDGNDTVVIDHG